jgi:hypothetical protein
MSSPTFDEEDIAWQDEPRTAAERAADAFVAAWLERTK